MKLSPLLSPLPLSSIGIHMLVRTEPLTGFQVSCVSLCVCVHRSDRASSFQVTEHVFGQLLLKYPIEEPIPKYVPLVVFRVLCSARIDNVVTRDILETGFNATICDRMRTHIAADQPVHFHVNRSLIANYI